MTMSDLKTLCVDGPRFEISTRRQSLCENFEAVIQFLRESLVFGELWIGGSYVTEKIDPRDIDVILKVDAEFYDSSSGITRKALDWFNENLKPQYDCDSYLHIEWPEAHPLHQYGEYQRSYWMKLLGFARDGTIKGIAIIKLDGTS